MSNLENVKEGDELLLQGFGVHKQIIKAERVTKNYIVLKDGRKFSKEDGTQVPRSAWNNGHISVLTEEEEIQITAKKQADYLENFSWDRLNHETLNELAQWMHDHGFDAIPVQPKKEEKSCH